MTVLGLTGGVGMGKSACAQLLIARGIPVVDTDELARQIVEPGQPALAEIQKTFGADVIDTDGRLLRGELARLVFPNPDARKTLEGILHPRIRDLWHAQVEAWRKEQRSIGVVVIPLLFETEAERDLDFTICIACSSATQQQRLLARNWTAAQIQQRVQAQWPVEKKMAAADYIIWTEGGLDIHAAQLDRILADVAEQPECARPRAQR
jgi:dephospho-CoA kinase